MSADVELLRKAARLMRERASDATPGPWKPDAEVVKVDERRHVADAFGLADKWPNAAHIASWHPAVALAVADWLDQKAGHLEAHIPAWTRPSSGVDDPPGLCWNNPQRLAEVVERHYGRALAVARAYLGGVA